MKKENYILFGLMLLFLALAPLLVNATIVKEINVQGTLKSPDGNLLSGDYNLIFRVYSVSSGGSVVFVDRNLVSVSSGYFSTVLGDANVLDLNFVDPLFVSTEINSDGEMTPRLQLRPSGSSIASEKGFDLNVSRNLLVGGVAQAGLGVGDVNALGDLYLGGNNIFDASTSNILRIGSSTRPTDLNVSKDLNASNITATGGLAVGNGITLLSGLSQGDVNAGGDVRLAGGNLFDVSTTKRLIIGSSSDPTDLNVSKDLNVDGNTFLNRHLFWTTGTNPTPNSYSIGRDLTATNRMIFNVPSGSSFSWLTNGSSNMYADSQGTLIIYGSASGYVNLQAGSGGAAIQMRSLQTTLTNIANFNLINDSPGSTANSASSGDQNVLNLQIPINQSSSAGYRLIYGNAVEYGTGSGIKNLLQLDRNGSQKIAVTNTGDLNLARDLNVGLNARIMGDLNVGNLVTNANIWLDGNMWDKDATGKWWNCGVTVAGAFICS